jgi:hypothetical protein
MSAVPFGSPSTAQTLKAGVDYHFNWGGPVVAKY